MENIAYYNGKISSIEEMMIPMNERSSYFGDGVYDAMFTVEHVPLQLDDHLRRFYRSAERIDIRIPMPFDELLSQVMDGTIADAKTVATTLKVKVLLGL